MENHLPFLIYSKVSLHMFVYFLYVEPGKKEEKDINNRYVKPNIEQIINLYENFFPPSVNCGYNFLFVGWTKLGKYKNIIVWNSVKKVVGPIALKLKS